MPARKIKRAEEDPNDKDDEMWNYYDVCKHYWIMDGWLRMKPCLRHKCTLSKMPKVSPNIPSAYNIINIPADKRLTKNFMCISGVYEKY